MLKMYESKRIKRAEEQIKIIIFFNNKGAGEHGDSSDAQFPPV